MIASRFKRHLVGGKEHDYIWFMDRALNKLRDYNKPFMTEK